MSEMLRFNIFLIPAMYSENMPNEDLTNQQLLDALTTQFDKRFDRLEDKIDGFESRMDSLETKVDGLSKEIDSLRVRVDGFETKVDSLAEMLSAVQETVTGIADNMATREEFENFKTEIHDDFDDLELRLGRRIDAALAMGKI